MLPKEQTMIRIDPRLKGKLLLRAEQQHRSLSNLCTIVLQGYIDEQEKLEAPDETAELMRNGEAPRQRHRSANPL